ncbi:MAG: hypothetical protein IT306_28505 [Chloroflexi bacterium]|nr:hypothetical protein [Chloroflexota bacterium]
MLLGAVHLDVITNPDGRTLAAAQQLDGLPDGEASQRLNVCGGTHSALEARQEGGVEMYSILYIIGAIVVIIVVLRLLGLY